MRAHTGPILFKDRPGQPAASSEQDFVELTGGSGQFRLDNVRCGCEKITVTLHITENLNRVQFRYFRCLVIAAELACKFVCMVGRSETVRSLRGAWPVCLVGW